MDILLLIIIILLIIFLCILITYLCLRDHYLRNKKKKRKIEINKDKYNPWVLKNLQKYFNRVPRKNSKIKIPILYINLDRSLDRREIMEKQLPLVSDNYERVSAIDGKKLDNLDNGVINGISFTNQYQDLTPSELGCTLSHLKAIKTAYDKGYYTALILEDDVLFYLKPLWDNTITEIIKKAPNDWEIIKIFSGGGKHCNGFTPEFRKFDIKRGCPGTVSYIINKSGMEKILYFTKPYLTLRYGPPKGVADWYIYSLVNSYSYKNSLLLVGDSFLPSTIHNENKNYHLEYVDNILNEYKKKYENFNWNITLPISLCLYINLDHRKDRKQHIEKELEILDIPYRRFEAIKKPEFGALGCSLSHIGCLNYAIHNNLNNILILEDDFELTNKNRRYIEDSIYTAFENLDKWDVILLTGTFLETEKTEIPRISKVKSAKTTAGYIVNNHYYQKLLNNFIEGVKLLEKNGTNKGFEIDEYWIKLQKVDNWYIFLPNIGKQLADYSDIENRKVDYTNY